MIFPQRTKAGFKARNERVSKHGGESSQPVKYLVGDRRTNSCWHHRIQSGRVDDVLNAAVLALTARDSTDNYLTLPAGADSPCDPLIVYAGT